MNQYAFKGGVRTWSVIFMVIGVLSAVWAFVSDPVSANFGAEITERFGTHSRFWTNFLHNSVFFTGISFAALFLVACHNLAYGGWHTVFKRVWEAMMMFLPIGGILIAVLAIGNFMGWHHIYLWNDAHALEHDVLVQHKSSFLNNNVYFLTVLVIALWFVFAVILRKLSIQEDTKGFAANYSKTLFWGAIFLPIAGFSSAFVIWQLVMSVDPHWYSTLFAWYTTVSWVIACVSFTILTILYLKTKGYFTNVTKEHIHDLGKYLFAFSVFWTYLWFSQYMLIWYANNGEETQYFFLRQMEFKPIFFGNLLLNFILPFLILMANYSKRTFGTVAFVSIVAFLGHWIDFYQMIKPGVWYNVEHANHQSHDDSHGHDDTKHSETIKLEEVESTAHAVLTSNDDAKHDDHADAHDSHGADHSFYLGIHFPGLPEFGMMLGFLGLFIFVVFTMFSRANTQPVNDAYFDESVHHHV